MKNYSYKKIKKKLQTLNKELIEVLCEKLNMSENGNRNLNETRYIESQCNLIKFRIKLCEDILKAYSEL